ncbi:SDR family NAD(P)-dependent oxidoreductase [Hansschlegelia quercus]|uniref:SDR family NAD(P)-dependent oxidoreductase n=1 Tax=Hansschlegelia quercus TaxID=2528245 RepID=A0A4Q9GJA6_9HYPH|nr:SDR family NAD(P)-dependent oxidoreductase [Hansschlegelia quercus]TBN54202.1 SDR family NAD(P)-dependent oxidoreductase [Hansschlegelia quercus]
MTGFSAATGVKTAWVTGASSGIGAALALELASEGVLVAATARSGDKLSALSAKAATQGGRIVAFEGDVTDADGVKTIAARIEAELGAIDLAVLNAGVFTPVAAAPFDLDAVRTTFDVNLGGTAACLAAILPAMTARRSGRIVVVASVTGYGGLPSSAAYGATKAGLINLAESLKFDLDLWGVSIQIANPGFVDTPTTAQNKFKMPALLKPEDAARRIVKGIERGGFEITFPKRFTYVLKALRLLPYPAYFWLIKKATGWDKKAGPGAS